MSHERCELLLQITAEDQLFADARGDAERDPECELTDGCGRHLRDDTADVLRVKMRAPKQNTDGAERDQGDEPETEGDRDIGPDFHCAATPDAQQLTQRRAAHQEAPMHQGKQDPLPD